MQKIVENIQLKLSMMPNGFSLFSLCIFQFQCFGHFLICKVCNYSKVRCVFPMVIWSELRSGQYMTTMEKTQPTLTTWSMVVSTAGNNSSLGSRWTQTATQMNGYLGSVQILPDQIQLLNSLMILLFLPIFQKLIYPAFEWCGVTVSPLRKMSLGQVHHLFGLMFDSIISRLNGG